MLILAKFFFHFKILIFFICFYLLLFFWMHLAIIIATPQAKDLYTISADTPCKAHHQTQCLDGHFNASILTHWSILVCLFGQTQYMKFLKNSKEHDNYLYSFLTLSGIVRGARYPAVASLAHRDTQPNNTHTILVYQCFKMDQWLHQTSLRYQTFRSLL